MEQQLKAIADHYGYESQSKMLVEEMAELTKEISKNWRGKDNILYIAEEIADVEIMLSQIKYLLGIEEPVEDWKKVKISRQIKRMEEEQ